MKATNNFFTDKKALKLFVCIVLVAVIILSTILILTIKNKNSAAYLYDESDVSVKYSIAQLSFDLSSNHMYTYYQENKEYKTSFEILLNNLNDYVRKIDGSSIIIDDFDSFVKPLFENYYSKELVDSLQTAWNTYITPRNDGKNPQDIYDNDTRAIYNTYYNKYEFLFKIKNFKATSVSKDRSIWYYYAKDLLDTYYGEYIVQHPADGVRQSTEKIGVMLKGGTTYNSDNNENLNPYYDEYFNDMVTAFTLNFKNTGNVNLYLNYSLNMNVDKNADKGVLGMVLPYGMELKKLETDSVYSQYYDVITKKWNYRNLISSLLENYKSISGVDFQSTIVCTDSQNKFSTLNYISTENLIKEWNNYALSTYQNKETEYINDQGNMVVLPYDNKEENTLNTSMIFWADYEKNSEYYNKINTKTWKTDDEYMLIQYNFNIDIKTSLKNNDLSQYIEMDWQELFNEREVYEKFAGVSNFDVEGYAYFEKKNDDGTYTIENAKQYMDGGYIICNYTNEAEVNYIKNLRFDIRYRGYSPAYIRVRFIEQFTNTKGEIEAVNQLKFDLGDDWYDNRVNDLYFYSNMIYYSTENSTLTTIGKPKYISIPVIKGLDKNITDIGDIDTILTKNTTLQLKVTFFAEAVQPNRTQEYWGKTLSDINDICR